MQRKRNPTMTTGATELLPIVSSQNQNHETTHSQRFAHSYRSLRGQVMFDETAQKCVNVAWFKKITGSAPPSAAPAPTPPVEWTMIRPEPPGWWTIYPTPCLANHEMRLWLGVDALSYESKSCNNKLFSTIQSCSESNHTHHIPSDSIAKKHHIISYYRTSPRRTVDTI